MRTGVGAHVDGRGDGMSEPHGRIADRLGRSCEGEYRAVGVDARIDEQQVDAGHAADGGGERRDGRGVSPLGHVRHALDECVAVRHACA